MPPSKPEIRQFEYVSLQPTRTKVSTRRLLLQSALRLVQFPFATLVGFVGTAFFGLILSLFDDYLEWSLTSIAVVSSIVGCTLLLFLTALCAMRTSRADHLGYLARSGGVIAVLGGTVVGLIFALFGNAIPAEYALYFRSQSIAGWSTFNLVAMGSAMLAAAVPSLVLAWAVVVCHETHFGETLVYIWADIETNSYHWLSFVIGVSVVCATLSCVPVVMPAD